jgi:lysine 6-dehydrogenase
MKLAVVGGGGKMASGTIRDLGDSPEVKNIVLIDRKSAKEQLEQRAKDWCRGKAEIIYCDINAHDDLRRAIRGCQAAANCTSHVFNVQVMNACLAEGAHYTDMGGLFHWAREQMKLDAAWKKAGLTAVLGMGSAPGIVNVMGRYAADLLDTVETLHLRDGIVNFTKTDAPLSIPYAMNTVLDEFVVNCFIFEGGDWKELSPFSRGEEIDFPPPVGKQTVYATIHSEVATMPVAFKSKGLKDMSFKLALPKAFEEKILFLAGLGFGARDPITVGRSEVSPRDVLVALCDRLPKPGGKPDDHKVLRVDVTGTQKGRACHVQVEVVCHPYEPWGMACGPFTVGFPVGLTLRLLGTGVIKERGAVGAESCVPPEPFFRGMKARGLDVTCSIKYPVIQN